MYLTGRVPTTCCARGSRPLLCGVRLSGEGRVVVGLELVRGDHAEATVEPAEVVPIDPRGGRELDVRDRLVRALVEDRGADSFGLVDAVDRLHQSVVVRVADGPDRGGDLLEREVACEPDRCVLGAGVRVKPSSA